MTKKNCSKVKFVQLKIHFVIIVQHKIKHANYKTTHFT